jgi:hypothetical protein
MTAGAAPGRVASPSPFHVDGRLALSKADAARALSVSIDSLEREVLPELRVVRIGRRVIVPVAELERYLEDHAARLVGGAS